jgi:hypothetical protein
VPYFGTPGAVFPSAVQIRENFKLVEHFYGTVFRQTECRILEHPVQFSRSVHQTRFESPALVYVTDGDAKTSAIIMFATCLLRRMPQAALCRKYEI